MEIVQDRVLGAVRFLDSTTLLKVDGALAVQAADTVVRRNRSGLYVIWSAPTGGTVTFTVSDPAAYYLPRKFNVQLPRDEDPGHGDQASSIFQPVDVRLLLSPTAATSPGWAIIRARVKKAGTDITLSGALIRVMRASDLVLLASGMSDGRGEAMIAVTGVPVTTFDGGPGPVVATEIAVKVQTVFDPLLTGFPDPDDLEARKGTLPASTADAKLASGRILITELAVTFA